MLHPSKPGLTCSGKRLDYIYLILPSSSKFVIEALESSIVYDEDIKGLKISDHNGVEAILKISKSG